MNSEVNQNKISHGKRIRDENTSQIPGSRINKSRRSIKNGNPALLATELPSFPSNTSVFSASKENSAKLSNKLTSLFRPALSTTSSFSQSMRLPLSLKHTQMLLQNHKLLEQKGSSFKQQQGSSDLDSQHRNNLFSSTKQGLVTAGSQKVLENRVPFRKCNNSSKLETNQCTLTSLNRRKKDESKAESAVQQPFNNSFYKRDQSELPIQCGGGASNYKPTIFGSSNETVLGAKFDMALNENNEQHHKLLEEKQGGNQFTQKYPWLLSRQQSYKYNQGKGGECLKPGMYLTGKFSSKALNTIGDSEDGNSTSIAAETDENNNRASVIIEDNDKNKSMESVNYDQQEPKYDERYYNKEEMKTENSSNVEAVDDDFESSQNAKHHVQEEMGRKDGKNDSFMQYDNFEKCDQQGKEENLPCLLQYKAEGMSQDNKNKLCYNKGLLFNKESSSLLIENVPTTACSFRYSKENAVSRKYSVMKDCIDDYSESELLYGVPLLSTEKSLFRKQFSNVCVDYDMASYGHFWYIHHKKREQVFQPWQLTLTGKIETLRLGVMAMYWESVKYHPVSLPTIYVAISNFNRLLSSWTQDELERPSPSQWALTAVVAYRLACKLEERPEVLWDFTNFWDFFPMFSDWAIDRSDANMNKVEMAALNILNDSMDIPLAPMFVSLYVTAGGWPGDVAKEYRNLAMYILGVVTFTSTKDHLLKNVIPSTLAIAALILAIKIVNGDRGTSSGILPHLSECPRYTMQTDGSNINDPKLDDSQKDVCICRYEFYPERLKAYCDLQLSELLPVIRGLSSLLRTKPDETYVLKYSFPLWGEHDWR